MGYTPYEWKTGVGGETPVSKDNLNHLEEQYGESKTDLDAHKINAAGSGKHRFTASKILVGAGAGSDPTEEDRRDTAWFHSELIKNEILTGEFATVGDFQTNNGTGDSDQPQNANDNNTATSNKFNVINEYTEVDFGKIVAIKRWRIFWNSVAHNEDGVMKIIYWDLITSAWIDWVIGIPTVAATAWTTLISETPVFTTKVRFIATAIDTNHPDGSILGEAEVYY